MTTANIHHYLPGIKDITNVPELAAFKGAPPAVGLAPNGHAADPIVLYRASGTSARTVILLTLPASCAPQPLTTGDLIAGARVPVVE
jgi:hypothetical protein